MPGRPRATYRELMTSVRQISVPACMCAGAYGLFVRPRLLRCGATATEAHQPYPGADLIPGGRRTATMAVTIGAPPSQVRPWLVQMGCNRAGWYSWDRLDNRAIPSADRIHPEWQDVSVRDHLPSTSSGEVWFEIAALEPERFRALRCALDLRRGRSFDTNGKWPHFYSYSSWCFLLDELPGLRTRLVVSGYARSNPRALTAILDVLFWEPVHWLMRTRQFASLRRRTERDLQGVTHRPAINTAVPAAIR
jgi:hypothetical protein